MTGNNDQEKSWEAVIACHHPTQPTRYYRGYMLHYPLSGSSKASTTLRQTLANWSVCTDLTISMQYPLLSLSDTQTVEVTASSLEFDQLMTFDADLRHAMQRAPQVNLSPGTMQLHQMLQTSFLHTQGQPPKTRLQIITGFQTSIF